MLANACCCDPSCLIESDDFDRANSNDIGGKFSDSNARIVDNKLGPQALGAMLVLTTKDHISETMVVDVTMSFSSGSISLDKGIVIVNAKDSNNYLFVQIEVSNSIFSGTAVSTKLKFYRRSGGVNTQLGSTRTLDATNALNNQQLRVCYDGTYLKTMGHQEAATKIADGLKAGLAAEGSTTIYHDNFKWYAYKDGCPKCNPSPPPPTPCFDDVCEQPSKYPESLLAVDLGAGGWTNGLGSICGGCTTIAGEFLAPIINSTCPTWGYSQVWCSTSFFNVPVLVTLHITVTLARLTPTQINWVCTIKYIHIGSTVTLGVESHAQYAGVVTSPDDCTATPITLTKTTDFHINNNCTGTLPATIEIRQLP